MFEQDIFGDKCIVSEVFCGEIGTRTQTHGSHDVLGNLLAVLPVAGLSQHSRLLRGGEWAEDLQRANFSARAALIYL
jgi:hypothetical protein